MALKELREEAVELVKAGIENREALETALPILLELLSALSSMAKTLKSCKEVAEKLSDKCSNYAVEHPSVFVGKKLNTTEKGVKVGDVELGDKIYHLACGYDGFVRQSGDPMSQSFLESLPDGWAKSSLKLDTGAINKLATSMADLDKYDLMQKPKNVWSLSELVVD